MTSIVIGVFFISSLIRYCYYCKEEDNDKEGFETWILL